MAIDPLRKANAAYRKEIVELKRLLVSLQRDLKAAFKSVKARAEVDQASSGGDRFYGQG